jgi:ribosomal protein S18 acetylase RimI-like enzyme
MSIYIVSQSEKAKYNLVCFGQTVFYNFRELTNFPNLKHNIKEIMRTIKSTKSTIIFFMNAGKVVGYLLGEIMKLNDSRNVFYVSYIYTSPQFRGKGIASRLLTTVDNFVAKNNLDGVMLTCDSQDEYVYDFYSNKGYMPDLVLRTYDRYEVMFK